MKRRNFLKFASVASLPFHISKNSLLGKEAPSNKITIGMIGTGNHGIHRNLNMFLRQNEFCYELIVSFVAIVEASFVGVYIRTTALILNHSSSMCLL